MAVSNPFEYRSPHHLVDDVTFGIFTTKEITSFSCKEIYNPQTFDELFHPVEGGLYDPALGPLDRFAQCVTCEQSEKFCPGHFGHIVLPLPVYNPTFFRFTLEFLKGSCLDCHRLYVRSDSLPAELLLAQLRALNLGLLSAVDDLRNVITAAISKNIAVLDENDSKKKESDPLMKTLFGECTEETILELLNYLKNIYKEGETAQVRCRNVIQKRQELLQNFCQKFLFKRPRNCPHCKRPTSAVRHHYYQSILIGNRKQTWRTELLKKEIKKEETVDDILPNTSKLVPNFRQPEKIDILEEMKTIGKDLKDLEEAVESLPADDGDEKLAGLVKNDGSKFCPPFDVKKHMRQIYKTDGEFISKIFPMFVKNCQKTVQQDDEDETEKDWSPVDVLFYDVIPVIPSKFRPVNRFSGMMFENPQSVSYKKILEQSQILRHFVNMAKGLKTDLDKTISDKTPGKNYEEKLHFVYIQLQMAVNCLYDSDLDKLNRARLPGARQILEKKEGLFRKHMMGKRVNFACRTVITPDPYQEIDQVGIPDIFAKKLTFSAAVNQTNLSALREIVVRGPNNIRGANFIINENGSKVRLDPDDVNERESAAKRLLFNDRYALRGCKKVYRQLTDGDIMLMNRQPTLHRPSIQAHKARILTKQKVIRLHYAVCKPYNADFDGDEMNGHFCQNDVARAEGYEIAAVPYQYLVPKDGTPVLGLIQDHIVSGVLLTIKDRFFSKEDYQYLVLNAFGYLGQKLKFLNPAIMRPVQRWTGKQVVSTVILNVIPAGYPGLNLAGKAKTSVKCWQVAGHDAPAFKMSESETIFRDGQLLCGVLDKADYGPTAFGLIHCCYELYHPKVAARLLSCFSRLFTTFLQYNGFSLGVSDVLVSEKADHKRKKIIKELRNCGADVLTEVFSIDKQSDNKENLMKLAMEEVYSNVDSSHVKQLDYSMKAATDRYNDRVNKACIPHGLLKLFPENALQMMIECGAKGTMVNQVQMSCMVGQIELEGCRPPLTPSGRTLPSFKPYDPSPRAGGFVDGRFATGIAPQEFFFHTMAGREGLIDTAVKTSRSGYLQRCIIKHLEGIIVNYDLTVRDADKSVIQFQYGEDGLDIGRSQFLNDKHMPLLVDNLKILRNSSKKIKDMEKFSTVKAEKYYKKIKRWKRKHESLDKIYSSPFLSFSSMYAKDADMDKDQLVTDYRCLDDQTRRDLEQKLDKSCPMPINSKLNPCQDLGCMSENLLESLDKFLSQDIRNAKRFADVNEEKIEQFRRDFCWKAMRALSEPGDAVGILAAQSIGEPSTQMTLNTFHFAGRGEMNVTLGIPRLREILMAASANIATPTAQVPFRSGVSKEEAEKVKQLMDKICLRQVLKSFKVTEMRTITKFDSFSTYVVELKFLKKRQRTKETGHLTPASVLVRVERTFFRTLSVVLMKKINKFKQELKSNARRITKMADNVIGHDRGGGGESDEEPQPMDDDAADDRRRERQNDETEYVGEAEEKLEIMPSEDEEFSTGEEDDAPAKRSDEEQSEEKDIRFEADTSRVQAVINGAKSIVAYDYDARKYLWCTATVQIPLNVGAVDVASVVKDEIEKFVIQQTPGVQRCLLREDKGQLFLLTEGINLQSFFEKTLLLDVNKMSCNDIHTIAKTYGIEAAAQSLIKEIKMVFGAYGIQVDYRHLSLVSDYMTHTGTYMPFNRTYMNSSASPFQKMSFETTLDFLKKAIYSGEKDELKTPSAQLVVGKLPTVGTGCFDLLVDLKNKK